MSKKKHPSNERKSARGHVEGNVIRFQLKQELVRIGPDGKPIKGKLPVNTFGKDWLSNHLLDPSVSGPPAIPRRNPPPDNVTSIDKNRKVKSSKPVSQSGNEAEAKPNKNTCVHGWLHSKAEAISDFKHWERLTKEFGRNRCGSEPWVERDGKLSSPSLERAREAAQNGHKGLNKLRFKKPPSTVHNPLIMPDHGGYAPPAERARSIAWHNKRTRGEPLDRKFWDMSAKHEPKAPSGIPISEFVTGKYKPKNAVVYTTPPPTPTRDWRASNDHHYDRSVQVRKTPDVSDWVYKTNAMVQWFINHVEVQNWPGHVHQFVTWKGDGPIPNTGAINKAASHPETELILIRNLHEGLEKDWKMIDSELTDARSENNLLRQELELTKQELASERQANGLMGYALSHHEGVPPEDVQEHIISKSKTPPEDADELLSQFKLFKSFVQYDGLESAFARYVYADPRLGDVIRDHADMRCTERQAAVEHRNMVRFLRNLSTHILSEMQAEYEQQKYDEYVNFWQTAYPTYLRGRNRKPTAVRDPSREAVAYAAMSRKAKPALHKPSSLYYSTFHGISGSSNTELWSNDKGSAVQSVAEYNGLSFRDRNVNSAVAKTILQDVKPTRPRYNNPQLVEHDSRQSWAQPPFKGISKYEQWWAERLDYCEVHYHEIKHPVKVGVVKTYNWIVDKLNTPVDPATRSRQAKLREQLKLKQQELDEKREQRKEERAAAKQRKAERDHIRKMQRLAH